jgi:hypothetical protein
MQQSRRVFVCVIAVLLVGSILIGADTGRADLVLQDGSINVAIPVGTYEIRQTVDGQEVYVQDFGRLLVPGKPNLPSRIFALAVPPGAQVTGVAFNVGQAKVLPGSYHVPPAPLPRVIGEENPLVYEREKQMYEVNYNSVYGSDETYPLAAGEFVGTAGFRKYNLIDIKINPFSYRPQSGQLTYYPNITVNVSYTFPKDFSANDIMVDNLAGKEKDAQEIILNYRQAQSWYPAGIKGKENYDFVIITLNALTSSVTPLVDWETEKGRNVNVVTTSWINSTYPGYDLAEKIRNFLRDKYPSGEWGIEDVLLVGDYEDVPMRQCWQNTGYGQPATDLYYAELSQPDSLSWDADKNHQWGEDSDPIDFYSEVNMGRIPWSDPADVLHICQKSVAYEQNDDPSFKKNILLLGAFFLPNTDNAVLMEAKVDQPWMSDWNLTRMYEEGYSTYPMDYNLSFDNVRDVWSAGTYAFVDWAGHGGPTSCQTYYSKGSYFVTNSTCSYLNDDYPAIIFADACSNSEPGDINIGMAMLRQGGVGFVGATKVAYGMPAWSDPSDGSSQSLDYFFTTCVTSADYTQGQAHQWALRYMYTHGLWYQVKYEMFEWGMLEGNPDLGITLVLTNYPPETPAQPSGIVEGLPGVEYQFSSSTMDPEEDSLYYLLDWADETASGWLGPYASAQICIGSHVWSSSGEFDVRVKAKDINEKESDWSEALSVAIYKFGDADGDGEINVGDVVYLINYLFKSGSATDPIAAGDANCDSVVDAGDVVYLINYLYKGGPLPGC